MKQKTLFFLTSSYPFGYGESFIENEINYLSNNFQKVIIIYHNNEYSNRRKVPKNVKLIYVRYQIKSIEKLLSLFSIFTSIFWKEISVIKRVYKRNITLGIIKTLLISISNSKRLKNDYHNIFDGFDFKQSVFYSYWSFDTAIALSMISSENHDFKSYSRIHGSDVFFHTSIYKYLPLRHYISENLTAIFSISQFGVNYCLESWKVKNPIKLSRLGVSYQDFNINHINSNIIVSCSNLIPLKRVDLIIKSLGLISDLKISWVHFGDGPQMNNIMELSKINFNDNINFNFMGRVSNRDVLDYYKKYFPSLFINLSTTEGIPVSIMEAMSFGIPVIATNVGGNFEIVNNSNGYLIDQYSSPRKIANIIRTHFLLSENHKKLKSTEAYNTFLKKFNADTNYTNFVDQLNY